MNNSAIEKGLFRAQALKKYFETIKKNPASSQTGIFMKPDRNKVHGLKDANYDKLTEEGYADLETVIKDGDVIIGMVNPNPAAKEDEKPYKDNSTIYKSLIPGAIDKVITSVNSDGYPIIKIRVRSERIPQVGDKFSCYDNQTEVLTNQGWIPFKDLTFDHQVATLIDGKKLVYEYPEAIQTYQYEGKMYQIKTDHVDLCVTPNHKMWVSQDPSSSFSLERADVIVGQKRFYQKNITQYGKTPFHYQYHSDKITEEILTSQLPNWIIDLDPNNIGYDLLAIILLSSNVTQLSKGIYAYHTNSKMVADNFQRLCIHAGWIANIRNDKSDNYILEISFDRFNPLVNDKEINDQWIDYNDNVYCCTVSSGVICVRRNGIPVFSGNSRAGQKGTVGFKVHRADMPFTKSGLIPDIILNPNAIPKRMTIGQLVECLLAKVCAIKGVYGDATPFTGIDIAKINEELVEAGYEEWGNETMYNGMTGQRMNSKIFIGPTYYQRLKQMVGDKAHSRARGPVQLLTHQPPEGKYGS